MSFFNRTLVTFLPLFPKYFVKHSAMRYVAGETKEEALSIVKRLNKNGFSVTLDILGEQTRSKRVANEVKDAYIDLYETIERENLDCTISLKLTHLGLGFDDTLADHLLSQLIAKAEITHNFLRIDMENSPFTEKTIALYLKYRQDTSVLGIVIQAYLRRSLSDISLLKGSHLNVRICKGIYNEPPEIAYRDKEKIRNNFITLVQSTLTEGGYVGIATHDLFLIDSLETWIQNKKIPSNQYEFQVLYGVPMSGRLEELLKAGHKVRIYVPFGKEWYPYAIRRLKENPYLAGYMVKNILRKK